MSASSRAAVYIRKGLYRKYITWGTSASVGGESNDRIFILLQHAEPIFCLRFNRQIALAFKFLNYHIWNRAKSSHFLVDQTSGYCFGERPARGRRMPIGTDYGSLTQCLN